jgi:hypothetical protein
MQCSQCVSDALYRKQQILEQRLAGQKRGPDNKKEGRR